MPAFTAVRQLISHSPVDKNFLLQQEVKNSKRMLQKSLPIKMTLTKTPACDWN